MLKPNCMNKGMDLDKGDSQQIDTIHIMYQIMKTCY